jgi:hypothetical protein
MEAKCEQKELEMQELIKQKQILFDELNKLLNDKFLIFTEKSELQPEQIHSQSEPIPS